MNVRFMVTPENQKAHDELVAALGSESNPSQWMIFMECVDKYIPELTSKGRPSNKQIENSLIGRLGFKSWKEMLNAPIENNGLNWSDGGWNSWRRAWTVVKEYPFLRNEPIKAGWINALTNELKRAGITFPKNKDEYVQIQKKREEISAENKQNKAKESENLINELNNQIQDLKNKLDISNQEIEKFGSRLEQADSYNHILVDSLEKSQLALGKSEAECSRVKKNLEAQKQKKPKVQRLTWFEALKQVFFLR